MSTKIVAVIKPFERLQSLYVYKDGNQIDFIEPTMDNLNKSLFSLVDEHEATHLDMVGPKQYLNGLSQQIEKEEMIKYSNKKLIINII